MVAPRARLARTSRGGQYLDAHEALYRRSPASNDRRVVELRPTPLGSRPRAMASRAQRPARRVPELDLRGLASCS
jgi:hypothetical protein